MLIFVTGGVRSGKSVVAEAMTTKLARSNGRLIYAATSIQTDEEMKQRVIFHQERRAENDKPWITLEITNNLADMIERIRPDDTVLLDCLTNLVTNELFAGWEEGKSLWKEASFRHDVHERVMTAIYRIKSCCNSIVIVSNELFSDIPIPQDGTFFFLKLLGKLHQSIINVAETAILVENGIPIIKKGEYV